MPGNDGVFRGAPAASSTAAQHQAISDKHRERYQNLTEAIGRAGRAGNTALAGRLAGHAEKAAALYRQHQQFAAQVARRDAPPAPKLARGTNPTRPPPRGGGLNTGSIADSLARAIANPVRRKAV